MVRATVGLALLAVASGVSLSGNARGFLASVMQPEVVARTLAGVIEEWQTFADSFLECSNGVNSTEMLDSCSRAKSDFVRSCAPVVTSMVQASNGQRDVVREYMRDVCNASVLADYPWPRDQCQSLAAVVDGGMSEDAFENRENFNVSSLCGTFMAKFGADEKVHFDQVRSKIEAERERREKEEAEEAKKEEESHKKTEEEAAEEAKKKEEEAKKKAAEEAKVHAEQVRAQAEEAARKLEEKKAEVEARQQEVAKAQEEAKEAEVRANT